MENETVAKLISIFETSTLTVAIILATAGIVMLIMRVRSGNTSNTSVDNNVNNNIDNNSAIAPQKVSRVKRFFQITQNAFIRALCIAALVAFLPELTYFNYAYYLRYFAGDEIATTTRDPENPQLMRLTNGNVAEVLQIVEQRRRMEGIALRFNNLNETVTSIYIDAVQEHADIVVLQVKWQDEEGTPYTFQKSLFKGLPHGYYIPLQPRGKVSELELSFAVREDVGIHIDHITLNKPIPFYLSGLRLLVLTFILFSIIVIANKETRTKLSYAFFQYKFEAENKKQTWAYVATVFLLIVLSWLSIYTSENTVKNSFDNSWYQHYNVYLVDALIAGRAWLDYGNPEKLLEWERPYDTHWRHANEKQVGVDFMFDWAWYNGKYYSYFGVVPAVILHVPYKLITGRYLSNHASIFVFCAIAIVMLALLWRYCVIKWMPNARFVFFMLGFLTLYFASYLTALLSMTSYHTIFQASGLMFAITGIYLLVKSIDQEKTNYILLFFACLSLALIAGCRPNMIFVSMLVPILLWKRRSWKLVAFVAFPYILIAVPLMWYNYIRFDSVTDFGADYMLTFINMQTFELLNPIGRFIITAESVLHYLFQPALYTLEFPYVKASPEQLLKITHGVYLTLQNTLGLINYPIVLCLLCMLKNSFRKDALRETSPMLYGFLAISTIVLIMSSYMLSSINLRYAADFAIFVIITSLFCAYYWCFEQKKELSNKLHAKLVYLLMGISITVGAFISIAGGDGPTAYQAHNRMMLQWLESVLSII